MYFPFELKDNSSMRHITHLYNKQRDLQIKCARRSQHPRTDLMDKKMMRDDIEKVIAVGLGSLSVKGSQISTNVLCATAGVRVEYAIAPNFGVSLTPEGCFAVSKKDMFDSMTAASSKIKGWATGANARLGVYVYF